MRQVAKNRKEAYEKKLMEKRIIKSEHRKTRKVENVRVSGSLSNMKQIEKIYGTSEQKAKPEKHPKKKNGVKNNKVKLKKEGSKGDVIVESPTENAEVDYESELEKQDEKTEERPKEITKDSESHIAVSEDLVIVEAEEPSQSGLAKQS